jgi:hypothetical protein
VVWGGAYSIVGNGSTATRGLITQSAVQDTLGARWLHPRMRNEEITRAFVRDIATNHLPHV